MGVQGGAPWNVVVCDGVFKVSGKTLLLSIPETCEETKLGRTKIYELIGNGQIEVIKVGRRTLVPYESLLAWLAKLREAA